MTDSDVEFSRKMLLEIKNHRTPLSPTTITEIEPKITVQTTTTRLKQIAFCILFQNTIFQLSNVQKAM